MRRTSLALSVAAIVLALTGSAFAGGWIITSTKQIKPSVRRALKGHRGPRGFAGPAGQPGPQGPPGPVVVNRLTRVNAAIHLAPGVVTHVTAACPPGMGAVSGVWSVISADGGAFYEETSGSDWTVGADNYFSSVDGDASVSVFCAPTGQAVAARAKSRAAVEARYDALDSQRRAAHQ